MNLYDSPSAREEILNDIGQLIVEITERSCRNKAEQIKTAFIFYEICCVHYVDRIYSAPRMQPGMAINKDINTAPHQETSQLHIIGLNEDNPPVKRASNTENVFIS